MSVVVDVVAPIDVLPSALDALGPSSALNVSAPSKMWLSDGEGTINDDARRPADIPSEATWSRACEDLIKFPTSRSVETPPLRKNIDPYARTW